MRSLTTLSTLIAVMAIAPAAQAELVTYAVEVDVTSVDDDGLVQNAPGVSDTVTVYLTVDDETADSVGFTGAWGHYEGAVEEWNVDLGGEVLAGAGGDVDVDNYSGWSGEEGATAASDYSDYGNGTLDGESIDRSKIKLEINSGENLANDDFPDLSALNLDGEARVTVYGKDGYDSLEIVGNITSITRVGAASAVAEAPELDPTSAASAFAVLTGGAAVLSGRRRRA